MPKQIYLLSCHKIVYVLFTLPKLYNMMADFSAYEPVYQVYRGESNLM